MSEGIARSSCDASDARIGALNQRARELPLASKRCSSIISEAFGAISSRRRVPCWMVRPSQGKSRLPSRWNPSVPGMSELTRTVGALGTLFLFKEPYLCLRSMGRFVTRVPVLLDPATNMRGIDPVAPTECVPSLRLGEPSYKRSSPCREPLRAASLSRANLLATRPRHSCLLPRRLEKVLNRRIRPLPEALVHMRDAE
jgi:hypothetical protein